MKMIASLPTSFPKVYRHFAAITVALTMLMAVFADGENREAISERQKQHDLERKDAEIHGKPVLKMKQYNSGGGRFASEAEVSTGGDNHGGGGAGISRGLPPRAAFATLPPQQVPAGYPAYGVSDEQLARMTPEQRAALLARLKAAIYGETAEARRAQIARLEAMALADIDIERGDDDSE